MGARELRIDREREQLAVGAEGAIERDRRFGDEAAVYAGGTELLLALKARVLRYAHLIDLKHIPELNGIRHEAGEIVIGALVSHFRLASDPLMTRLLPAYAVLSDGIANIRVRVAGTLGGNLCFGESHADTRAVCGNGLVRVGPNRANDDAPNAVHGRPRTHTAARPGIDGVHACPSRGSTFAHSHDSG